MEIEHQLNVLPTNLENTLSNTLSNNLSDNLSDNLLNDNVNYQNDDKDLNNPTNLNQNNLLNSDNVLEDKEEIKKKNYSKLLRIRERIDKLSKEGKIEIFKIIHKNNEKFSKNNNGVMFDIKVIKGETIEEIAKFLNFSDVNQKNFDLEEMKRNDYRIDCN
jgi:hypothetical protein